MKYHDIKTRGSNGWRRVTNSYGQEICVCYGRDAKVFAKAIRDALNKAGVVLKETKPSK